MAEAVAVISLVASIVALVDFGTKVVERLNDFTEDSLEIPKALQSLHTDLPLLLITLEEIQEQAKAGCFRSTSAKALTPVVESAQREAEFLADTLSKYVPPPTATSFQKRLQALKSLASDKKVQACLLRIDRHMGRIMDYQITANSTALREGLARMTLQQGSGDPTDSLAKFTHGLNLGRAPQLPERAFVGRGRELEKLSDSLLADTRRKVVALTGLGGLGKTQLAITYAQRYHHRFTSVFWLSAKDEITLRQALTELSGIVLDSQSQVTTKTANNEDHIITQVLKWFALPNNSRWLLIFDNYDDPKLPGLRSPSGFDIRTYFPTRSQGSILITSRSQKLDFAEQLKLQKFEQVRSSLEILSRRSGRDLTNDPDAMKLAQRLDGFPLALTTAGAYLSQATGEDDVRDYLSAYENQWDELEETTEELLEYSSGGDEGGRTLFSTWILSLDKVRLQNPCSAEMLRYLAFFGNSGITFELFHAVRAKGFEYSLGWLQALTESSFKFNKIMATLHNYSLVEHSPQGYYLHPCVHDWALQTLNKTFCSECYWSAMLCLEANLNLDTLSSKYNWQNNQRVLQHATQLWRVRLKYPPAMGIVSESQADIVRCMGNAWRAYGNPERAEVLVLDALNAYERLGGIQDAKITSAVVDLANVYVDMARNLEAEKMYQRALQAYEKTPAPGVGAISRVYHNLGLLYRRQGKILEAEEMLRKALADCETSRGLDHTETFSISQDLAFILGELEKFSEAQAFSQRSVDGLKEALGPYHVETSRAMYLQGTLYARQDQWKQAEQTVMLALEGYLNVLGFDHEQTRTAVALLGQAYAEQQKLEEVIKLRDAWGNEGVDGWFHESMGVLGRRFLRAGYEDKAVDACQKSIITKDGIQCWSARCDGCQGEEEYITLGMGRFICTQCCDNDLCRECYTKHKTGAKVFESCVGHFFYEVPAWPISTSDEVGREVQPRQRSPADSALKANSDASATLFRPRPS